jgi:hypothetical protein
MVIIIGGEEEEILGHKEVEVARIQVTGTTVAITSIRITTSFSSVT